MYKEIDSILLSELQKIIIRKSVTQDELMENLGCSKTQLRYKIAKMNSYLRSNKLHELSMSQKKVHSLCSIEDIISIVPKNAIRFKKIIGGLASDERIYYECILIFCSKELLGVKNFHYAFQISRNSILNDINKLRSLIAEHSLTLEYSRQKGYCIAGKGEDIRSLIFHCIYHVRKNIFYLDVINQLLGKPDLNTTYETTRNSLHEVLEKNKIKFIDEYFEQVSCMITFMQFHYQSESYRKIDTWDDELEDNYCYALAGHLNLMIPYPLPLEEIRYLEVLLLCMSIDLNLVTKILKQKTPMTRLFTIDLVNRFNFLINIRIGNNEDLVNEILNHLLFSYFRMRYGFYIVNPFLQNIMKYHGDIFNIVKMMIPNINSFKNMIISDHEIGYIVMYLITLLDSQDIQPRLSALLVCPGGQAIAALLINKLTTIFPTIDFHCVYEKGKNSIGNLNEYNIVFTTTDISDVLGKPCFNVSKLMSDFTFNTNALKEKVNNVLNNKVYASQNSILNTNDLIYMIKPYCNILDINGLRNTLSEVSIFPNKQINIQPKQPSLKECLSPERISVVKEVYDWKDAIRLGAAPLVKSGDITSHYIDACIQLVLKNGPYIIVYPFISMPHAFSSDGVNRISMSLLHITHPVNLLKNPAYPIQVFIMLAAVDNKLHIKALGELSKILSEIERRNQLLASCTKQNILDVLFA